MLLPEARQQLTTGTGGSRIGQRFLARRRSRPASSTRCLSSLRVATRIARDSNTQADGTGYVTTFEVDANFIARYEPHEAGGRELREYWIPAEDLEAFNAAIRGSIEVVAAHRGDPPERVS